MLKICRHLLVGKVCFVWPSVSFWYVNVALLKAHVYLKTVKLTYAFSHFSYGDNLRLQRCVAKLAGIISLKDINEPIID